MGNKEKTLSMYEYQNEVLKIYDYTQNILSKYNIKCWAHSGTLLGIIRHNNDFIPWDDDIDIMVSYKELDDNYDQIEEEINSVNGEYHIFNLIRGNFIKGYSDIKGNLNLLRVYSRKKVTVETSKGLKSIRPFIDIMVAAPADTFNSEKKWKSYARQHQIFWVTRRGFNRYQRDVYNKRKTFIANLTTYPLKIIYRHKAANRIIKKPWNKDEGDWNILRRTDPWTYRNIVYDINKLQESNLRGVKIYISEDPIKELDNTFVSDWRKERYRKPHYDSNGHWSHERNIMINDFLSKKYD